MTTKNKNSDNTNKKTSVVDVSTTSFKEQPYLLYNTLAMILASIGITITLFAAGFSGVFEGLMSGDTDQLNLVLNLTTALTVGSFAVALLSQNAKNSSRDEDAAATKRDTLAKIKGMSTSMRALNASIDALTDRIELEHELESVSVQRCENTTKLWKDMEPGSTLITFGADGVGDIDLVPNSSGGMSIVPKMERLVEQLQRHHLPTMLGDIFHIYVIPRTRGTGKPALCKALERKLCQYKAKIHVLNENGLSDLADMSNVSFYICEDENGPAIASFVGTRRPKLKGSEPVEFLYRYELPILTDRSIELHDNTVEVSYDPEEVAKQRKLLKTYMRLATRRLTLEEALLEFGPDLPPIGDFDATLDPAMIEDWTSNRHSSSTYAGNRNAVTDFGDGSFQID